MSHCVISAVQPIASGVAASPGLRMTSLAVGLSCAIRHTPNRLCVFMQSRTMSM